MTVYETDLPGVGKKHEIELDGDARLVIVTHNTGEREVFRRDSPDADSERLFELSDELARQVGTVLEGAYFQPVRSESIGTMLDENSVLEWIEVEPGTPLAGRTLEEASVRRRTGASVLAIQRDEETIANPAPDQRVEAGDTLIVLGCRDECRTFADEFGGD